MRSLGDLVIPEADAVIRLILGMIGLDGGHDTESERDVMRLYRGLKGRYRLEVVGKEQGEFFGTDFTDCPLTALEFARGRRGVVLVLGILAEGQIRISEELWFSEGARRMMVWGRFDKFLVAEIPAKDLRAQIRKKGIVTESRAFKSTILGEYIDGRVAQTHEE